MTLETIPRYDSGRISEVGDHAVVVGGSMAGLLAGRVLADAFGAVTVIESDDLPDEVEVRRGVPQGQHVHAMMEPGRVTLEDLFPGYTEELEAAGGEVIDISSDFRFYDEGGYMADGPDRLPMYCASRPLFEHATRRGVEATDGVTLCDGCQKTGYLVDEAGANIEGVAIRNEANEIEEIRADLVVDATGRTSSAPGWLEEHGYARPERETVEIDLAYGTVYVDRPPEETRALHIMLSPPQTRGGVAIPVEGDRWVVTFYGIHGDHPPSDVDGLQEYAAGLPTDDLRNLLEEHEILSGEVSRYPFPASLRRRYWELDGFPEGLVVIGDAIASFNPVYGQGMSVSALEALHLHHALAEGGTDDLALRFFDRVEQVVDDAWNLSVGTDFNYDETTGPKPAGTDLLNRYVSRLTRKAHDDGELSQAYSRVATMERRPTSLLHPRIAWRVLRPSL